MLPPPYTALLATFSQSFLAALLLNGVLLTAAYLLFWRFLKTRLQTWKIQLRTRVDARQIRRELKNALFTLTVGATMSCGMVYLSTRGYTKIYRDFSAHHWLFGLGGFFGLLLVDDTWFYWCHRLLHHPVLFRHVHREHHKSVDVNPYSSLSFHFLEALLLTLWIVPVAFIFPLYSPVLALVQLWGLLENLKSHLGYELYPADLNRGWLRFLTSSTHHNQHHSRFIGNYGVHFRLWDRLLGTEFPDYETEYDQIQARKRQSSALARATPGTDDVPASKELGEA